MDKKVTQHGIRASSKAKGCRGHSGCNWKACVAHQAVAPPVSAEVSGYRSLCVACQERVPCRLGSTGLGGEAALCKVILLGRSTSGYLADGCSMNASSRRPVPVRPGEEGFDVLASPRADAIALALSVEYWCSMQRAWLHPAWLLLLCASKLGLNGLCSIRCVVELPVGTTQLGLGIRTMHTGFVQMLMAVANAISYVMHAVRCANIMHGQLGLKGESKRLG